MNKDALSKLKLKNKLYHRYLRTNHQLDYKTCSKYQNQSKRACRKAIAESPFLERWKLILKHFLTIYLASWIIHELFLIWKMVIKALVIIMKKAKTFNMFFASVFTKETDTLPELHTPSGNTIDSITLLSIRWKVN